VSTSRSHRSSFAVRPHAYPSYHRGLTSLFSREPQEVVIDLRVLACIRVGISSNRIVFAIEFSGPLGVRRLPFPVSAIEGYLYVATRRLIRNGVVPLRTGGDYRIRLVEFPCAHEDVLAIAECDAD